jgi:hypothetical protein
MWIDEELQNEERHAELADRIARAINAENAEWARKLQGEDKDLWNAEWAAARDGLPPIGGAAYLKESARGSQVLEFSKLAALAANTVTTGDKEWIFDRAMQLVGIRMDAFTAGAGNPSVIDLATSLQDAAGASIYTVATTRRPTLLSASTGDFIVGAPDAPQIILKGGDRLIQYTISVGANPHIRFVSNVLFRHV